MYKKNKRKKLIFLFVILFSIFLINFISANGCCVNISSSIGGYCDEVAQDDCSSYPEGFASGTSCDYASFPDCKLVACMDYNNMECMSGVPKITCIEDGLVPDETKENCNDVEDWKEGCCVMPDNETYYGYQIECEQKYLDISSLPEMDFREGMNKNECDAIKDARTFGACVILGGCCGCTYTTYENCLDLGGDLENFHKNTLCSSSTLSSSGVFCSQKIHSYKECYNNDIYWFDECENREESFKNCTKGEEICEYGECRSLNCYNEESNLILRNGESECVYDGLANDGFSAPGSTHWRKYCDQGEIKYDTCGDGRANICQQATNKNGTLINQAFCIPNYPEECFAITSEFNDKLNNEIADVFASNKDHHTARQNLANEKRNEIVGDINTKGTMAYKCDQNSNCFLYDYPQDKDRGEFYDIALCLPKYPTNNGNYTKILDKITKSQVFFKDLWGDLVHRYDCSGNCQILNPWFFNYMNKICVMSGDFGLSKNYYSKWGGSYSYEPSSRIIYDNGFKRETRKKDDCLKIVIWPHENEKGESKDFCKNILIGGSVAHCKIDVPQMFQESSVHDGMESFILDDFKTITGPLEVNMEGIYTQLGSIEDKSTQEILTAIINQNHDENFNTFDFDNFIERSGDKTWGWDNLNYLRKWQNQNKDNYNKCDKMKDNDDRTKRLPVSFKCLPWTPPASGTDCSQCDARDSGGGPCTEYKCHSLGQGCVLINNGTNNIECVSLTPEFDPPEIENVSYIGDNYKMESYQENPWKIIGDNGEDCFFSNDKLEFNITLDERARCKYGYGSYVNYNYDGMPGYADEDNPYLDILLDKHSFNIDVPNINSVEDEYCNTIDGKTTCNTNISIKCRDTWGNVNLKEWIVNYCIKQDPDKDPPELVRFEPKEKEWPFNPNNFTLDVYLNEETSMTDGGCRFNYVSNINYEQMPYNMTCSEQGDGTDMCYASINITNAPGTNDVWIACNDTSGNINNDIHYRYAIEKDISEDEYIGCCGLKIDSISLEMGDKTYHNGDNLITSDPTPNVELKVTTSGGPDNGESKCYFGDSAGNEYAPFTESNSTQHRQIFNQLNQGNQTKYVRCKDSISEANKSIIFNLTIDQTPPIINHTIDGDILNVFTNEDARCSYELGSCGFNLEDGAGTDYDYSTEHQITGYNPAENYYVKCSDRYGNENCTKIGDTSTEITITRISHDAGSLKIKTNRKAKCYYDFKKCGFNLVDAKNESRVMSSDFVKSHSTPWNSATTYYIKCQDEYENPLSDCVKIQPNSIFGN